MSLINRLRAEAKTVPPPSRLQIRPQDVGTVTEHILATVSFDGLAPRDAVRASVEAGRVMFLGIPVKVIGN